jgi:uncharacterized protein (DUF362 family)
MNPDPVPAGVVLFGTHPPSVDAAGAYLMGFDPDKIPIVARAFQCRSLSLADHEWRDIVMRSNIADWNMTLPEVSNTFHLEPHFGWKGHIEQTPKGEIASEALTHA